MGDRASAGQLAIDRGKRCRQPADVADDGVAAAPEQGWKVGLRACVDRDAEHRNAQPSRLPHGLAGVFDCKAAFIVIDVVGLSVGQHQQEFFALRLVDQLGGGMADRRVDARVVARFERADTPLDGSSHRLLE